MRDMHYLEGPKRSVDSFEEAIAKVREIYPTANAEGSTGGFHFHVDGEIVGEFWIHRTKPTWWLRIKRKSN